MDSTAFSDRLGSGQRSGHSTVSTSPVELRSNMRFPSAPDGRPSPTSSPTPENNSLPAALNRSSLRRRQFHDGPPTSGNSTPLREPIIESPTADSFPDFHQPMAPPGLGPPTSAAAAPSSSSASSSSSAAAAAGPAPALGSLQMRRRAGTLPSRLPGAATSKLTATSLRPSRPPSSASPPAQLESVPMSSQSSAPSLVGLAQSGGHVGMPGRTMQQTSILSVQPKQVWPARFRSDSLPTSRLMLHPFGHQPQLDRGSPLAHLVPTDEEQSPANGPSSASSRQALVDGGVRTLDYLGLMDPSLVMSSSDHDFPTLTPLPTDMVTAQAAPMSDQRLPLNRFRSHSVNASERYHDQVSGLTTGLASMGLPSLAGDTGAMSIQEAIMQHNMEVKAFLRIKSSVARPRSKTVAATLGSTPLTMDGTPNMPSDSHSVGGHTSGDGVNSDLSGLATGPGAMESIEHTPSRAIWLGNIPSSTTISSLNVLFGRFGIIESSRVLTHKNCGFVNFDSVDCAVRARNHFNGKEIFPGAGPTRIGFAKAPSRSNTPGLRGTPTESEPDPAMTESQAGLDKPFFVADREVSIPTAPTMEELCSGIVRIVAEFGAGEEEQEAMAADLATMVKSEGFNNEIMNVADPRPDRVYDAPRLREIRKRIDNHTYSQTEIEAIAMAMLPEIAELSSDYLGNTVVQKLFENCSDQVREAMLAEIAPHLASIGVHKNGTWAAQKIIDVARTGQLMSAVSDALGPYAVALFLDQFGNYVIQGCLRYPSPLNDFIFQSMVSNLWDLAQSRFGARAMRACLESHYATKRQQMMVAAAIAIHSVRLATNANGALLLTWFLDTCTLANRRIVLAPLLIDHLPELCTHKVAYLTVLKLINQRTEPEARYAVLNALFFSSSQTTLEEILSDSHCGPTFIFKVITSPFFDDEMRPDVIQNVRTVLQRMKAQPHQGYKRLMDEVGLSTRHGSSQNNVRDPKPVHMSEMNKHDDPAGPHRGVPLNRVGRRVGPAGQKFAGYGPDGGVVMGQGDVGMAAPFPTFDGGMFQPMPGSGPVGYPQSGPVGGRGYYGHGPMVPPGMTGMAGMNPVGAGMGHGQYQTAYPANGHMMFQYAAVPYVAQPQTTDSNHRGMGYQ